MRQYTISDLENQLTMARNAMRTAGMPDLRLTRTCDDDAHMARLVESADPFQPWYHRTNPHTMLFTTPIYDWGGLSGPDDDDSTESFRHGSLFRP